MKNQIKILENGVIRHKIAAKKNYLDGYFNKGQQVVCYEHSKTLVFQSFGWNLLNGKFTTALKHGKVIVVSVKSGKINCYWLKPSEKWNNVTPNPPFCDLFRAFKKVAAGKARINKICREFLKKNGFKVKRDFKYSDIPELAYPALKDIRRDYPKINLSLGITDGFRRASFNDIIKLYFGSNGRTVNKLCHEILKERNTFAFLGWARALKGLLPLEFVVKFLSEVSNRINAIDYKNLRKLIKAYGRERREILLNNLMMDTNIFILEDLIRIHKDYPGIVLPEKPKNFLELHDYLASEQRKLATIDRAIPYKREFEAINRAKVDDLEIVLPKSTHELVNWGQRMSNCLGSYANLAVKREVVLFAAMKGEEMAYNVSIRGKKLEQFYGPYNRAPDENDKKKVVDFLTEKGILTKN